MFSTWKRYDFLYYWSSEKKERDDALKILHGETKRVIDLRRKQINLNEVAGMESTNTDDDDAVLGAKQRRPFLDSLLIAQHNTGLLTDANIEDEVNTFMFGV